MDKCSNCQNHPKNKNNEIDQWLHKKFWNPYCNCYERQCPGLKRTDTGDIFYFYFSRLIWMYYIMGVFNYLSILEILQLRLYLQTQLQPVIQMRQCVIQTVVMTVMMRVMAHYLLRTILVKKKKIQTFLIDQVKWKMSIRAIIKSTDNLSCSKKFMFLGIHRIPHFWKVKACKDVWCL